MGTFDDNRAHHGIDDGVVPARRVPSSTRPRATSGCAARSSGSRSCPSDPARLEQDCYEAYNIQVSGLEQRLRALNYPKVVIGVSGGLDSTHALIVAARAMDREERPRSDILAFTLPGFATGERTKSNAIRLAEALGVTFEEIDIKATAELMLSEMDHPFARGEKVYDVTFENVQAGLRTDYLFRLANQRGGIVLGTGDLSELALGWSTYGVGDQMSHYNVNGGVPKTLIQHLIRWVISSEQFDDDGQRGAAVGARHRDQPGAGARGRGRGDPEQRGQGRTRMCCRTSRCSRCCGTGSGRRRWRSWPGTRGATPSAATGRSASPRTSDRRYSLKEIRHWLQVFVQRFYSFSQFKRSALPNGPKVSHGGSLSPRGDWRAPSDMSARTWLDEIERDVPES